MEELLKKYLESIYDYGIIKIRYYNIEGSNCSVSFWTDNDKMYKERMNINIWDMLIFLNNNNNEQKQEN